MICKVLFYIKFFETEFISYTVKINFNTKIDDV